jgi:glycosyltransferase involved in cell wall biosynthesis
LTLNKDKNKISAFVVVHNEYYRINTCLASLFGQVDEIVLIDDESNEKKKELLNIYSYWKEIYNNFDVEFKVIHHEHLGSHSLYYPIVLQNVSHDWLFQLDGDEIFQSPSKGILKSTIDRAIDNNTVALGMKLFNIKQDGKNFLIESVEKKTRM